jgi:uncharacterized membrane protein
MATSDTAHRQKARWPLIRNRLNHLFAPQPRYIIGFLVTGCCLLLLLCSWFYPAQTSAHAAQTTHTTLSPSNSVTMQVNVGFDSTYKIGYWTPVSITLNNHGAAFHGTLSINTVTRSLRAKAEQLSPWNFEAPVTLSRQGTKQVMVNIPLYPGNASLDNIIATLRNEHGTVITRQDANHGVEIQPGEMLIGLLTDPQVDLDVLNDIFLPGQIGSLTTIQLDAQTMPTTDTVLENFDILVLDSFTTSALHPNQLLALQTWVNRGGVLIEIGGPAWKRTLSPLPDTLLPVTIHGTQVLPPAISIVPSNDPIRQNIDLQSLSTPLPEPLEASVATLRQQGPFTETETLLAADSTPLLVQAHQGQGLLCYLGIDPADPQLMNWSGTEELWTLLLMHALGDQTLIPIPALGYNTGPGELLTRAGILNMLTPEMLPGPTILVAFLCGYALILGPVRLLIIRRLKYPQKWRLSLFLGIVFLFSFLAYNLTSYQRNASIVDDSVSIIQMTQDGLAAHVTTYSGIFVPNSGDFHLHLPGNNLTQPLANQFILNNRSLLAKKDLPASIEADGNDTQVTLQGLGAWTLHHTISEQDIHVQGKIATHLFLRNGKLMGTVSNTLSTALNDVYVLLPHRFATIGHLAAGETLQINVPLSNVSLQSGNSLADQIAESGGVAAPYSPYTHNQRPQTDFQRHMALLSALNGTDYPFSPCKGSCKTQSIPDKETLFITGGRVPNPSLNSNEPLLIPGASATLIGWADQSLTDDITVNGWHPISHQENFLQMPLSLDLSQSLPIPPDVIEGHMIDITSFDAELRLPGVYAMGDGTMTFEMLAPDLSHLHVNSMTITEPDLWAHPFGSGSGFLTSHLQAQLYNWNTSSWENITLQQDTFTTSHLKPYLGPGGRVLLQISNKDSSLGSLYFAPPSLGFT